MPCSSIQANFKITLRELLSVWFKQADVLTGGAQWPGSQSMRFVLARYGEARDIKSKPTVLGNKYEKQFCVL